MEEEITITHSQMVQVFERWRAEALAGDWKDGTAEQDAETFIDYARQITATPAAE